MDIAEFDEMEQNSPIRVRRNVLFDTLGELMMHGGHPESLRAIALRIEIARVALDYPTKKSFSEALGITQQGLNHYLQGHVLPPIPLRQKLWVMGVHPGWLLHGEEGGLTVEFKKRVDRAMALMGLIHPPRSNGTFDY